MAPRFLLDENFDPRLARAGTRAGLDVVAVAGTYLMGRDDLSILNIAIKEQRIVVTYDVEGFLPLVSALALSGIQVPGLLIVNSRTLRSNDLKGLLAAILKLAGRIERGEVDPSMGVSLTR
jgi:predicted nuclease of predicted toxin-antitoxin system